MTTDDDTQRKNRNKYKKENKERPLLRSSSVSNDADRQSEIESMEITIKDLKSENTILKKKLSSLEKVLALMKSTEGNTVSGSLK